MNFRGEGTIVGGWGLGRLYFNEVNLLFRRLGPLNKDRLNDY